LKKWKILLSSIVLFAVVLVGCSSPDGKASFVYLSEQRGSGFNPTYEFVEYYPQEERKQYVNRQVDGNHYRNSYYDGKKLYLSLSHTFFIYDSETKKVTELQGTVSNGIKKINDEIWLAVDNGFVEDGYSSSLCKLTDDLKVNCLYEMKNQRVDDFYFNFSEQIMYGAGPGVGKEPGEISQQYKVMKYNLRTGEEETVWNNGSHILAGRLTNICPGEFITSDGDIYKETGEKVGEIIGTSGEKLNSQINDLTMNETTFLDYDNNLLEVYGCEGGVVRHRRTVQLDYQPNIYPVYYAWETTDDGEITMPINDPDDIFEFIGFQSVNVRTGEIEVYMFDEPVYELHAIARFV